MSIEDALEKIIAQADSLISGAEQNAADTAVTETSEWDETLTDILPGFPEKVEGEIVFCDADNVSTDATYPGKYTYRDNLSVETMAEAATAIIAKEIPLVVAGSFGNTFSRNSINNGLVGVEAKKLTQRLRETFKAEADGAILTRRTGWRFVWDVRRSKATVTEGEGGQTWSQKVGELPLNVQEIIACGGLEKRVMHKISA
ncbi:hypothetical protein DL767_005337 [Monosporascus sp. MG133]|nr:hypothetical protein DL767_005337 [Monosporascus sp. MG133]